MSKKIDKVTKLFIGEKEIEAIDGLSVGFKDGTSMKLTERQMEYMVTSESKDASEFRNLVIINVVRDVMAILEKHDIRKGELQPIVQTIISSYNNAFSIAVGKAFGTYEKGLPVETQAENIKMSDIKRLIDDGNDGDDKEEDKEEDKETK